MATISGRGVTAGLVLLGLLSAFDIVTTFIPPGDSADAVPVEILVFGLVPGLGSLVLLVVVWRGRPGWPAWLLVALRAVSALLALPAFVVPEVPPIWRVLAAIFVVLTVVGIVLIRPTLRGAPTAA